MSVEFIRGQQVADILALHLEEKEKLHPWLPGGVTLLAGKSKSGKSTLAEQIVWEISLKHGVLYLALEYNIRMAQSRFSNCTSDHNIHLVLEGQIDRMGKGGEEQLTRLIEALKPRLIVIDVLAKIKRLNIGSYDAEYHAMSELKEIFDNFDVDALVITHAGKPNAHDGNDPFDKIIGSTALQGVPDNLLLLSHENKDTKLSTKGRLLWPNEKILTFSNGRYTEKTGAGADISDRAPVQADILDLIDQHNELRVNQLASMLGRSEAQISEACKRLAEDGRITRVNLKEPYRLVKRS